MSQPIDTISKDQIDAVVQKAAPEIALALELILTGKETCHALTLGQAGYSKTGMSMKIEVFVCTEFVGAVLESVGHGLDESNKRWRVACEAAVGPKPAAENATTK